jgi:hypothetical protein
VSDLDPLYGGPVPVAVPRVPRIGDDVLYHFVRKGSLRTRPAKITEVNPHTGFANLVIFYDATLDGFTSHERTGWESSVRRLTGDAAPMDRTWSYQQS